MTPIGVDFLDLDADSRFHYERMKLRSDYRISDEAPDRIGTRPVEEILDDPNVALVWVGRQARQFIPRVLNAGKHVLCGLPYETTLTNWDRWLQQNSPVNGRLHVAALHRWDSRFEMVRSLVESEQLGQLIDVRRLSRLYVPGELGAIRGHHQTTATDASVAERNRHLMQIKWFELLDELLHLVTEPIISVCAKTTGLSTSPAGERGLWASVLFESGCQALLELHRHSLAPLETGWVLNGTQAGFADGKRFNAGADFELIDVPLEEPATNQVAFYDALAASIQGNSESVVSPASMRRVIELNEMIKEAIAGTRP